VTVAEPEPRYSLDDFNDIASEPNPFHAGANGDRPADQYIPFAGLTHAEVLALQFDEERMLVQDLVPVGAVGTIAGVPETYKSWQAQTIAISVAHGQGSVLGFPITHQGNVGYFWQDDSTREEAERIKLYHRVKETPAELPIRWHLNEGLRLPEHLERLRHTIEHHEYVLCVLDSLYNVLFGTDLKDDEAERVIALLKSEIADPTGCTILLVDHMPWATADNRQRLRSYGGVFKSAATRFGIYIDAVKNKLYVEARGNNITGFKRQPAEWDPDALELRLIDTAEAVSEDEYEQRILEYLEEHPDAKTAELTEEIKGTNTHLIAARKRLLDKKQVVRQVSRTSERGYRWNRSVDAEIGGSSAQTNQDELPNWFGGSTSSPLRGDTSSEPPTATAPDDDGIPF
jgi:hypothetical protein